MKIQMRSGLFLSVSKFVAFNVDTKPSLLCNLVRREHCSLCQPWIEYTHCQF